MRRKVPFSVYIVAFIGLLLPPVTLVALLPSFINTEPVRARLLAELNDWSGGEVRIAGAVSLDSFFSISVEVKDVDIRKLKSLPEINGIHAGKVVARISSFDLLVGNLDFDKIKIYDATVKVEATDVRAAVASLVAMRSVTRENPFATFAMENTVIAFRDRPGKLFQLVRIESAAISLDRSAGEIAAAGSLRWKNERVEFSAHQQLAAGGAEARQPLKLEIESAILSGQFEGETTLAGIWEATGYLDAHTPDMKRLAAWLGFSSTGFVPGGFGIKGIVDVAGGQLSLRAAEFALGGQTASGSLTVTPGAAVPHVEGSLAFAALDLNGLTGAWQAGGGILLASRADADLRISADTLVWRDVKTGAAGFTLTSKAGKLSAEIAELVFLDGSVRGQVELEAARETARLSARLSAENVNAAELLTLLRQRDWLTGRANANIEAELELGRDGRILDTATARSHVDFPEGGQIRLDIPRLADAASAAAITGWDGVDFTTASFDDLRLELSLKNGRVNCDRLELLSTDSIISGMGQIDLTGQSLDLRFTVVPSPGAVDVPASSGSRGAAGQRSSLSIQGAWSTPVIRAGAPGSLPARTRDPAGTKGKSAAALEVALP